MARDASGNFSANTITATLLGSASLNLLLTGGTLTGPVLFPVGSASTPSVQVGSSNVGLSNNSGTLQLSTSGIAYLTISGAGVVALPAFSSAGLVHNDASGDLTSSLLQNTDIPATTITTDKLATASDLNNANYIVVRDGFGNFAAGTITANLVGNVTGTVTGNVIGHASLDLALSGGTMTGPVLFISGTPSTPSLQVGVATVGLSENSGTLQFATNSTLQMSIDSSGNVSVSALGAGVVHSNAGGVLTSSQVIGADIANATVTNSNLITLTASGLVSNSATTATPLNTANAIVAYAIYSFNFCGCRCHHV